MMGQLFLPFFRDDGRSSNSKPSVGFYIASEIARAHAGRLRLPPRHETRITLPIPRI